MENTSSYQSADSSRLMLESIYQQLSRRGVSVVGLSEYQSVYGKVYDFYIDRPLDKDSFRLLYRFFVENYRYMITQLKSDTPILRFLPIPSKTIPFKRFLTMLTVITVGLTGYGLASGFLDIASKLGLSTGLDVYLTTLLYTLLFLAALGFHEFGHMVSSKREGVLIEGPIFIPAPPIQLGFIGTFGALIMMKTIPPSRRDLARLGISGPLFGVVAGALIGIVGVFNSISIPLEDATKLAEAGEIGSIPITTLGLELLLRLRPLESEVLLIHPLLFITYIIFIVTFLNLLPIGQLDGGHVLRSLLSPRAHEKLGNIVIVLLASIGVFLILANYSAGFYYLMLSLVVLLLKRFVAKGQHPGSADHYDNERPWFYLIPYIAMLIIVTPIPIG
ncbi:MAG: site-2 protease family protein [Thermosphaera sp.]